MFDAESSQIRDLSLPQSASAEYEVSTLLIARLYILHLNIPWVDATLVHIQNPENILRNIPEELKFKDQSTLVSSLERLWEVDPMSILAFESGQRAELVKLFAFKTGSETRLGLGPGCLQDSDILCPLSGTQTVAI
jgi:hypothetical protein